MDSYHVSIFNESDKVVQLKTRHWVIRDSSGKTEEVRGPGVIGKQPILLPVRASSDSDGERSSLASLS